MNSSPRAWIRRAGQPWPDKPAAYVPSRELLAQAFAWAVFVAVVLNTLAYVLSYSNPVVISDAWYFLDAFVSKAIHGTLQFSDFFVQRGGLDHSQPLKKLILLFELRYFDLDMSIQAIIGLACAGGSLLLLRHLVFHATRAGRARARLAIVWAGLCVALVSLNSTHIWTWPLVAGSFTAYLLLFALLASLWHYLDSGRLAWPVIIALALDFSGDDRAILVTIAAVLALALTALKEPQYRRRGIRAIVALVLCLLAIRIAYPLIYTPPTSSMMAAGVRTEQLVAAFADGGWWQWFVIPLGASVAYKTPLESLVGDASTAVHIGIAIVLACAHLWFWWRALRARPDAPWFAAIAVMLLFYAMLAGILYARVSMYGNNYLHQGRYVLMYSFSNVALLLMFANQIRHGSPDTRRHALALACTLALVAWQIPVSGIAWQIGPYVARYQAKVAKQVWIMAHNGYQPPEDCLPLLPVCNSSQATRTRLIRLLHDNQLNVFSEEFQHRHQLQLPPPQPPQT